MDTVTAARVDKLKLEAEVLRCPPSSELGPKVGEGELAVKRKPTAVSSATTAAANTQPIALLRKNHPAPSCFEEP